MRYVLLARPESMTSSSISTKFLRSAIAASGLSSGPS
jgi:hypothetical protein